MFTEAHKAGHTVSLQEEMSLEDRKMILDMLGLINEDGTFNDNPRWSHVSDNTPSSRNLRKTPKS